MWIQVYTKLCLINEYKDTTVLQDTNTYKLVRMEQKYDGTTVYVFNYIKATKSGYIYTTLDKNLFLIPIINEFYSNPEFISIDFLYDTKELMKINVKINTDLISLNYNNILIKSICQEKILSYQNMLSIDISNILQKNSFIPINNCKIRKSKLKDFNVKLFDYQKASILKMSMMENKTYPMDIQRTFDIQLGDINIIWDPFYNKVVDVHKTCTIISKGGILADSMGLGKTLTMIGLMHYNKNIITEVNTEYIKSKATVVIVPSHLAKQWADEYTKAMPRNIIISVLTKTHHVKTTYHDFKNADIIIVSQQFLLNFKNYIEINYRKIAPAMYNPHHHLSHLTDLYKTWIRNNIDIDVMIEPLFELFHFNRVIIDEGHEIFENNLGSPSLNRWLLVFINKLKASYKWYVSGTPFTHGFIEMINYLDMKLKFDDEILKLYQINKYGCMLSHETDTFRQINNISNFIVTKNIMMPLLSKLAIRHLKEDISISIPGYIETIEWINLTESEQSIYNSKRSSASKVTLQQLCCHPLIVDSMKRMFGDTNGIIDLDKVQANLISYHKTQIQDSTNKIRNLDTTNQAYHMLLANYNSKISESTFMLNILEKISNKLQTTDKDTCVICFSEITYDTATVLTSCGHLYCEECIVTSIKYKSECPTCKAHLNTTNKLYRITDMEQVSEQVSKQVSEPTPFINKYGAKLGKLIQMIRNLIIMNNMNRIIVFSQWDDMLTLIGKCLAENGIANSFIKGNVHCRNKAIKLFKQDSMTEDSRVIMLSLKNSASGTNLTEASHIFLVEPINMSRDERIMIEGQAIGRACRLGQTKTIEVIRILCKNTIEEDIYKNLIL